MVDFFQGEPLQKQMLSENERHKSRLLLSSVAVIGASSDALLHPAGGRVLRPVLGALRRSAWVR